MDDKKLTTEQLTMIWHVLFGLKAEFAERSKEPFWKAVYFHPFIDDRFRECKQYCTVGEGASLQEAAIDLARQLRII